MWLLWVVYRCYQYLTAVERGDIPSDSTASILRIESTIHQTQPSSRHQQQPRFHSTTNNFVSGVDVGSRYGHDGDYPVQLLTIAQQQTTYPPIYAPTAPMQHQIMPVQVVKDEMGNFCYTVAGMPLQSKSMSHYSTVFKSRV